MEVDTGAAVSLVSEVTCRRVWPDLQLEATTKKLQTYSGEALTLVGEAEVAVKYGSQQVKLPLLVVAGEGRSLFGRDWLSSIRLNWHEIHQVQESTLESVLNRHTEVFQGGLGTLKGYRAKIHIDPDVQPRFCKARSVPYSMRVKVEEKLSQLVEEGILEPIQFADWAAPIVPVLKSDKSVRICGDFKCTVNQECKLDRYPIPKVEDLFAQLAGGRLFTKLDLSQAYLQVLLDEESKKYVVINTHRGLFRYNRLPYGLSSAPGIFQRVMESLLQGISGVVVYLDDILITGRTVQEHLATLEEVLQRMETAGLRLKKSKCKFLVPSVTYLGHQIDAQGLHPVSDKVKAIQEAPEPRNVSALKSYLGLLSYYSRFLPNMSSTLAPLYKLLKKKEPWCWSSTEREAFRDSKRLLLSSRVLVHFNPELSIVLACDASSHGVGAVLSHKMPDGTERPIGFASRTLTETEKRYSQLEKEGLACVFGVTRFHSYLFGHHFTLVTDHKPLTSLFGNRPISPQVSGRIQRWALKLQMYEYTLIFRSTAQHGNADALSRLPLPEPPSEVPLPAELVLLTEYLENSPVTAAQIKNWTLKNPQLAKVLHYIQEGWPDYCVDTELKPYWSRRAELSVLDGCMIWSNRVLIPEPGREYVLAELHGGHPGASRMKALARMFVWWPGMDHDIEQIVKSCSECQQSRPSPQVAPLHPWEWPNRPWARLHIDFAGPLQGKMFMVLVDSHSKWIEVIPMSDTTSAATIQKLRTLFAQFGIPESIVSDNGPQFTSAEFSQFCHTNAIRHILVTPYHPASNGLAERAVQTFKQGFKRMKDGTLTDKIARFLFSYRTTPQSTTGITPAELLMNRKLRSRLDLLKPDLAKRVTEKQEKQKSAHDYHAAHHFFQVGDEAYVKNFRSYGPKWLSGRITQCTGPVSVRVELPGGFVVRRHYDQVRQRTTIPNETLNSPEVFIPDSNQTMEARAEVTTEQSECPPEQPSLTPLEGSDMVCVPTQEMAVPMSQDSPAVRRYPTRIRKPPDSFQF